MTGCDPLCVTVIAALSVLPDEIIASVTALPFASVSVPFVTDRSTVISNGAPSATLTLIVAGPAAVKTILSVRSSWRVSLKGAPGLSSSVNLVGPGLDRPENTPAGRVLILLSLRRKVLRLDRPENTLAGKVRNLLMSRRRVLRSDRPEKSLAFKAMIF